MGQATELVARAVLVLGVTSTRHHTTRLRIHVHAYGARLHVRHGHLDGTGNGLKAAPDRIGWGVLARRQEICHALDVGAEAVLLHPEIKVEKLPPRHLDLSRLHMAHRRVGTSIDRGAVGAVPRGPDVVSVKLRMHEALDLDFGHAGLHIVKRGFVNALGRIDGGLDPCDLFWRLAPAQRGDHLLGRDQPIRESRPIQVASKNVIHSMAQPIG